MDSGKFDHRRRGSFGVARFFLRRLRL